MPPAPSNIWTARQRFASGGVVLTTGGGGAARVASHRSLAELAASGLAVLCGQGKGRDVKLTDRGDAYGRALCGLPGLSEARVKLQETIRMAATADGLTLTSELWLAGLKSYTPDCQAALWELSLTLAPALARGWVESRSDCHGRAFYIVTDSGRTAAEQPCPVPPTDLPEYDLAANVVYSETTLATRAVLRTAKPSNPAEIGQIPLSCSLGLHRPRTSKASV